MAKSRVFEEINAITKDWTQGDYTLIGPKFPLGVNPKCHIATEQSLGKEQFFLIQEIKHGFSIISQTCDIVRDCKERPYIEAAPLVRVEIEKFVEIKKNFRPSYTYVPSLEEKRLVIDLERVMTLEKSVLKKLERQSGCNCDDDRRKLSQALARKRSRPALPESFSKWLNPLIKKIKKKHDKATKEGKALKALREIRVKAAPSWQAQKIDTTFYFILKQDEDSDSYEQVFKNCLNKLDRESQYSAPVIEVLTLEIMSAKDYVDSDQLDLNHLS